MVVAIIMAALVEAVSVVVVDVEATLYGRRIRMCETNKSWFSTTIITTPLDGIHINNRTFIIKINRMRMIASAVSSVGEGAA